MHGSLNAETLYRQALALNQKLLGEEHPAAGYDLLGLGDVLLKQQEAARAEPLLRRALAIGQAADLPAHQRLVASSQKLLGASLLAQSRFEEAEAHLLAAYDGYPERSPGFERTVQHLARLYEAWGRPEEAAAYRTRLAAL